MIATLSGWRATCPSNRVRRSTPGVWPASTQAARSSAGTRSGRTDTALEDIGASRMNGRSGRMDPIIRSAADGGKSERSVNELGNPRLVHPLDTFGGGADRSGAETVHHEDQDPLHPRARLAA